MRPRGETTAGDEGARSVSASAASRHAVLPPVPPAPPAVGRAVGAGDDEISIVVTVVALQPREFVPASRRTRRALLGGVDLYWEGWEVHPSSS
jgi:hypothetical protein